MAAEERGLFLRVTRTAYRWFEDRAYPELEDLMVMVDMYLFSSC